MYQNVFGSDGQIHFENQVGCQHFDLTTGEVKTVIPTAKNMSIVFGKDGVETEIQVGQMRQTLGKPGFGRLFYFRFPALIWRSVIPYFWNTARG